MIFKRLKIDKGESVTIMGLASLGLLLFIGVFIVDFAKTLYIKNLYTSFAQKATQTAIKAQDAIGGLKPESAEVAVQEYMTQRTGGGNTGDTQAHRSNCELAGNYPKIQITYDNKRIGGSSSPIYSSDGGAKPSVHDAGNFYKQQYKTIQLDIVDVTDNYFYGIFGVPCAEVNVYSSAISATHYDEDN